MSSDVIFSENFPYFFGGKSLSQIAKAVVVFIKVYKQEKRHNKQIQEYHQIEDEARIERFELLENENTLQFIRRCPAEDQEILIEIFKKYKGLA